MKKPVRNVLIDGRRKEGGKHCHRHVITPPHTHTNTVMLH